MHIGQKQLLVWHEKSHTWLIITKPGTGTGIGVSFMVSQRHTEPAGLSDPLLFMYSTARIWSREVIVRDEN